MNPPGTFVPSFALGGTLELYGEDRQLGDACGLKPQI